jgi:hypothetical protein
MEGSSLHKAEKTQKRENVFDLEENKKNVVCLSIGTGDGVGLIHFQANELLMKRKYNVRRNSKISCRYMN